jgi:hypothetical protein
MILYIITWTFIYLILIFLLHNLYLFFQENLTITKNKDYYNNVLIETNKENISIDEASIDEASIDEASIETTTTNLNIDFNNQMKNELNDFISKM